MIIRCFREKKKENLYIVPFLYSIAGGLLKYESI